MSDDRPVDKPDSFEPAICGPPAQLESRRMISHLLRKASWKRSSQTPPTKMPDITSGRADIQDVHYAYRLLLGRSPDALGLETYANLVRDQVLTPFELAEQFLGSNEFRSRYSSGLLEIDLGSHVLMVRADDTDVGRAVANTKQWEPHVAAVLQKYLQPGGRFLDVEGRQGFVRNTAESALSF